MANTLGGVNLNRISQLTLDSLKTLPIPLNSFTQDFSADAVPTGNAITTRFVTNPTAANFLSSKAAVDQTTTSRVITLNNYIGVSIGFTDTEMSFSDVKLQEMFIQPALVAMFENVYATVTALINIANFPQNVVYAAANFTAANVADIASKLTTAKVPMLNRHLTIPPTYAKTLKTDTAIQASYAYGDPTAIRTGMVPRVYGFDVHEYNGTIPTNSENLFAYACNPQALCLATRVPVLPRNWYGQVTNITEPNSGLTVQFRDFYDNTQQITQFCLIFGTQLGVVNNLYRITNV